MLSGGKDSVLALHLAREQLDAERMQCVHLHMAPGLQVTEAPIRAVCRRYGVEWFALPHVLAAAYLATATYCDPNLPAVQNERLLVYRDIEAYARQVAGASWVIDGQRAMDSLERRGMFKSWGILNEKHNRAHPIAYWNDREVESFVAHKRIPTVPRLGANKRGSGVGLDAPVLRDLRERYPSSYTAIMRTYPHAGVILAREDAKDVA